MDIYIGLIILMIIVGILTAYALRKQNRKYPIRGNYYTTGSVDTTFVGHDDRYSNHHHDHHGDYGDSEGHSWFSGDPCDSDGDCGGGDCRGGDCRGGD